MNYWAREPFGSFINDGDFRFTDAGPLHTPVLAFSIRRNDKLEIVLEAVGDDETKSNLVLERAGYHRAGTVRQNTDSAILKNIAGTTVTLSGVSPRSTTSFHNVKTGKREVRQEVTIHEVSAELLPADRGAYTIDFLENVSSRYYLWPDVVVNKIETIHTRTFGREAGALAMSHNSEDYSSGRSAIKLTVSGVEFYLCSTSHNKEGDQFQPGYILFTGTPDKDFRHKIRAILSFTLGMYLVYLGTATYSGDWRLTSFQSFTAYSIDKKAFDLPVMPPSLLGDRAHNEPSHGPVARLVNALYTHYDDLQFGSLSWAYWHALCAPLHIAAVHFGAAIEALQRRYVAKHSKDFPTKLVSHKGKWDVFAAMVNAEIEKLDISDDAKNLMKANTGLLNQVPRRVTTEELLNKTGLVLGEDESRAWKGRHDAAHGNDTTSDATSGMIRNNKLLKVIFHRMLLKAIDGSDQYYDYASLDFPLRPLADPVPLSKTKTEH